MSLGDPRYLLSAALTERTNDEDLTRDRIVWLSQLRWVAVACIGLGVPLHFMGALPAANWPMLAATAIVGATINVYLRVRLRRCFSDRAAGVIGRPRIEPHLIVDMLLLTASLWAIGGVRSPFLGYYFFHIALMGILAGGRGAVVAAILALICAGFLLVVERFPWMQIGHWETSPTWGWVADLVAFTSVVFTIAYIVTHAVREVRAREGSLRRFRERASLEEELLTTTLGNLDVGLEAVDASGRVVWQNKVAASLAVPLHQKNVARMEDGSLDPQAKVADLLVVECPGASRGCDRAGVCPIETAYTNVRPGQCRFSITTGDREHIYEMNVIPLSKSSGGARFMHLYVDRTEATLQDRRMILAERLASLGRISQGVAHELNTPIATIRTLASDMRKAIFDLRKDPGQVAALAMDLEESATLVHDETRRLGKVTQALLAGGDLVRNEIHGSVPVGAVVERACALVFAGFRRGSEIVASHDVANVAVAADSDRLVQVLVNLVQNAYDAAKHQADPRVSVSAAANGNRVEIAVEDNGPGLSPGIRARLFEPFATTKPSGQGTGLGLYTSYMLVAQMNGSLSIEDRPQGGTRAVISLPVSDGSLMATPSDDFSTPARAIRASSSPAEEPRT